MSDVTTDDLVLLGGDVITEKETLAGTERIPLDDGTQEPFYVLVSTLIAGLIRSDITGIPGALPIDNLVAITQENYDVLDPEIQDENTFITFEDVEATA